MQQKTNMARIFFILSLLISQICNASQERVYPWEEVNYKLTLPEPHGIVKLKVALAGEHTNRKIISMSFAIGEIEFHVPTKAFSGIDHVKTNSIRIQSELHNPNKLGVGIYIVFNYGDIGQHTVHIITRDLELISRTLRVKTSETSWQHHELKF